MGRKKQRKVTEEHGIYEIESVVKHKFSNEPLKTGCTFPRDAVVGYDVQWKGYPNPNDITVVVTKEFQSWTMIAEYWREKLEQGQLEKRELAIARSMLLLQEFQKESFTFICDDRDRHNLPFEKFKWDWQIPWYSEDQYKTTFRETLTLYEQQVNAICEFFRNHPKIKMVNDADKALPVPLNKLICNIETRGNHLGLSTRNTPIETEYGTCSKGKITMDEKAFNDCLEYLKAKMEKTDPFPSDTVDLSTIPYCQKFDYVDSKMRPMDHHAPRVTLILKRHLDKHWELLAEHDIKAGDTIMLITGEMAKEYHANTCMQEEGEIAAFMSYVHVAHDLSLETKYRHGFDRYIKHACEPNCYVDFTYPLRRPLCPPLCTVRAKIDIPQGESLTLDWFERFERPDPDVDYTKGHTKRDHVACKCDATDCRKILWVERMKDDADFKLPKKERLLKLKKKFKGMPLRKNNLDDRNRGQGGPVHSQSDEDAGDEDEDDIR